MEKYLFMKSFIQLIAQGSFFRKAFAIVLRVLAVPVAIAGLVGVGYKFGDLFPGQLLMPY